MYQRNMFTLSVLFLMAALPAHATFTCPPMPTAVTSVNRDIKSEISASVGSLGKIKAGEIAAKTEIEAKNLFGKYPNVDKLLALQMMASTYCEMLRGTTAIKEIDKINRWEKFSEKYLDLKSNPQVSTRPPSRLSHAAESKNEPVVLPLDLCKKLGEHAIYLEANNYHGVIGSAGIPLKQTGDGSFRFATNIVFSKKTNREFSMEINDPIAGTCKGKAISFTRKLWDGSAHRHSGTISEAQSGAITIEGSFLDENDEKHLWSGRVDNPIP